MTVIIFIYNLFKKDSLDKDLQNYSDSIDNWKNQIPVFIIIYLDYLDWVYLGFQDSKTVHNVLYRYRIM